MAFGALHTGLVGFEIVAAVVAVVTAIAAVVAAVVAVVIAVVAIFAVCIFGVPRRVNFR